MVRYILDNSLLLLAGTAVALVWANLAPASYDGFSHRLHFAVNDVAMAFFFALAAKEVFEATLPGGALASPRLAAVPLVAAVGGMAVPAGIYAVLAAWLGPADLLRGWAIPCATDIAFSYMAARVIFPPGHAAIPFLLLLAIADDALGLIVLAVFYPAGPTAPVRMLAILGVAMLAAWFLRRRRTHSFWPYVLGAGAISWTGLYVGGVHPALALVPIVPFMPHAPRDAGLFDRLEDQRPDTLNRFEYWWKTPVQIVLCAFALVNAGVPFAGIGAGTWYVLAGLVAGKPIGIAITTVIAARAAGGGSSGLTLRETIVVGTAAGIGFTVALFFAAAAFPAGAALEQTKMGALLSFSAAPLAIVAARALRVGRWTAAGAGQARGAQ